MKNKIEDGAGIVSRKITVSPGFAGAALA